ncbi:MAG: DUF2817 domain-containing protein [Oligoflexia bacterium]|nr:DUF2817 domain-containing protein [Oligoflexia bacterium]MBF0366055.1 DUF2817 domain-containing protein [Oligoflexia bacterium]
MQTSSFTFSVMLLLSILLLATTSCQNISTPPDESKSESKAKNIGLPPPMPTPTAALPNEELTSYCTETLKLLPGKFSITKLQQACAKVNKLPDCSSTEDAPIYHFDRLANKSKLKILVIGVVHGDEHASGSVARSWIERLIDIEPRNSWRIIPIANPDGMKANTRTNKKGVDLNRNFPSKNWNVEAISYWKKSSNKDPRRFPGKSAASEKETICLMKQISDFSPHLIVAIHTPLGVLDFDGPELKYPQYSGLPWIRLGNFPGSLGRFMWKDRRVPVLTIELKGGQVMKNMAELDRLQDVSGLIAIKANEKNAND